MGCHTDDSLPDFEHGFYFYTGYSSRYLFMGALFYFHLSESVRSVFLCVMCQFTNTTVIPAL